MAMAACSPSCASLLLPVVALLTSTALPGCDSRGSSDFLWSGNKELSASTTDATGQLVEATATTTPMTTTTTATSSPPTCRVVVSECRFAVQQDRDGTYHTSIDDGNPLSHCYGSEARRLERNGDVAEVAYIGWLTTWMSLSSSLVKKAPGVFLTRMDQRYCHPFECGDYARCASLHVEPTGIIFTWYDTDEEFCSTHSEHSNGGAASYVGVFFADVSFTDTECGVSLQDVFEIGL